jgi:chaperone LolA
MRISKLISLFIIYSAFIYCADDSEKILSKLQNKYESVKDITVNFTQEVTFGISKMQQKIEGTIRIKKGNKYRIELEKQTIVTDGKTVWSHSHINNQVIVDKFKDDPKSLSPDHVLINVPKNYNAIFIGNETLLDKKTSIIKLTPKDDKSLVKFMKVWVDLDEYLMRKIEIVDVSDNVNIYIIKSINLNTGIPDDTFLFEVPKGVEKVDLR